MKISAETLRAAAAHESTPIGPRNYMQLAANTIEEHTRELGIAHRLLKSVRGYFSIRWSGSLMGAINDFIARVPDDLAPPDKPKYPDSQRYAESEIPTDTRRVDDLGVHVAHCCLKHGCKYGEIETCPVTSAQAKQEGGCRVGYEIGESCFSETPRYATVEQVEAAIEAAVDGIGGGWSRRARSSRVRVALGLSEKS